MSGESHEDDPSDESRRVIEDILHVADRVLIEALREIDGRVLALALKTATPALKDKFLLNMTGGAAQVIREEMEAMGPVRLADVEEAQHTVTAIVFLREAEGDDGPELES